MSRPWHKADPARLEKMQREVQADYPNLHFYPQGDRVVVRGTLPILHEGGELDRYAVEIILLASYPDALPLVFEVGGRVPRDADHHVNRETGEACLFVPDERWKVAPPSMTFLEFLNASYRTEFLALLKAPLLQVEEISPAHIQAAIDAKVSKDPAAAAGDGSKPKERGKAPDHPVKVSGPGAQQVTEGSPEERAVKAAVAERWLADAFKRDLATLEKEWKEWILKKQ